jgi:glycosyltransferase 2 family protein
MSSKLLLAAKIMLSIFFFYILFQIVDIQSSWNELKKITIGMFALCIALMLVQVLVSVIRWKIVLDGLGEYLHFRHLCNVMYMSSFFNLIMPGTVGGDAVRMWQTNKKGVHISKAMNSVLIERIATLFGLILLVVITQPFLINRIGHVPGEWIFPSLIAIGSLSIGTLLWFDKIPMGKYQHLKIVRGLHILAFDTRMIFLNFSYSFSLLFFALFGQIIFSLIVYVLAVSLDINITILDCMVLVPPAILIMTLPVSIAGWGARELVMVTTFAYISVPSEQSLALSILFGLVVLCSQLPAGFLWLLRLRDNRVKKEGISDSK